MIMLVAISVGLSAARAGMASPQLLQTTENPVAAGGAPDRLTPRDISFNATADPSALTFTVDLGKPLQTIEGFGGAITDAVAHVFNLMPPDLQEEALEALWGPSGQRYNLGRLTIGSTDFATTVYNYDEVPGDYEQRNFSIAHDEEQIIPLVLRAQAKAASAGAPLEWISSPWSPPGWMKRGWLTIKGYMRNSDKPGMLDDPQIYQSYALYLSKYLSAYKAAGVAIRRMTIQNEPETADHMFPVAYPACNYDAEGEGTFLRDYLGPQLASDGHLADGLKVYIHDGQKVHDKEGLATRVAAILATNCTPYVHGVAFHWYEANCDNYEYLAELHAQQPSLRLLATEATLKAPHTQLDPWANAQKYAIDVIGDLNAGAEGWIEWNVLLDSDGGPTCIGPTSDEVCTPDVGHCDAPLLYDVQNQTLERRDSYHIMAHFSRFIARGSRVLQLRAAAASAAPSTSASASASDPPVAVATVDASKSTLVVVVLNPNRAAEARYNLDIGGGRVARLQIPPHAVQTILVPL